MSGKRLVPRFAALLAVPILAVSLTTVTAAAATPFLTAAMSVSTAGTTVPGNGDINPYGVVVVGATSGRLVKGDVLISNFNNAANQQGTGTTIVELAPGGALTLFASLHAGALHGACPGGVGLTTALGILDSRWVIVGSLPTSDGTSATAKRGCLILLDNHGNAVGTVSGRGVNGPWDLTAVDQGDRSIVFVTNVLDGTVERLQFNTGEDRHAPELEDRTQIGSGFAHRADAAALFIGPTGLDLGKRGVLYVADTLSNRIAAIPDALQREGTAFAGADVTANGALNGPLGLTIAPNGDILTVNSSDGNIVETTPHGTQVAVAALDTTVTPPAAPGAGTLFGLAIIPGGGGVYFVDDGSNTLNRFS